MRPLSRGPLTFLLAICLAGWVHAAPLPTGVALVPPGDVAGLASVKGAGSTVEMIPVAGQSFDSAVRVTVAAGSRAPWDVQLLRAVTCGVNRGDAILFTFWVKAERPLDGSARLGACFQKSSANYLKSMSALVSPPGKWTRIDVPFAAKETYAASECGISFHLAYASQVVDIGGICVTDYGTAVKVSDLPAARPTYAGREADAPWRKVADANIDRYRKADIVIKVVDGAGRAIAGANVNVTMQRHAFPFGTCVASRYLTDRSADGEMYRAKLASLFTIGTPENELKWNAWQRSPASGIATVDWLQSHGLSVRGHNLVWPSWKFQSQTLHDAYAAKLASDGKDAAARWLADTIDKHLMDEVSTFKGRCADWDVVNEGIDNHVFEDIIGPQALPHWFVLAHSLDPGATLLINEDASIYGQASDERVEAVQDEVKKLLDDGAPLGGVGLESHVSEWAMPTPEQVLKTLDGYARLHVPVRITEYDLKTEDKDMAADYTRDFLTLCFSHPAVTGFIMWGFWDGDHWLGDAPLFNNDWSLKPSGKAFMDLVFKKWWTTESGATGSDGSFALRGFQGEYKVSASHGGATKDGLVHVGLGGAALTMKLDHN